MAKQDKQTKKFLKDNPNIHITLWHHHEITRKANNIEQPLDDTIITFEYPNGSEYNIKYSVLRDRAAEEQKTLSTNNGN